MSTLWECTECEDTVTRGERPPRCRRCGAPGARFVSLLDEDDGNAAEAERRYERWVRHGMPTTDHWRAHWPGARPRADRVQPPRS